MPLARQLSVPHNINLLGSGAQAIINATLRGAVALFIAAIISLTQLYKQRFANPKRV
ncbi:hypothetical protein CICRMM096B_14125 [Citrobacter cronae]